jgi:hypothetical protein
VGLRDCRHDDGTAFHGDTQASLRIVETEASDHVVEGADVCWYP